MRVLVLLLASFLSSLAIAADTRNTVDYHVVFDIEAHGKSALVNGYGGYLQIYEQDGKQWFRYCENFDGGNASGRPNPKRDRFKLVPIGTIDDTAYHCRDFTQEEIAIGQPLIELGNKSFFALKTSSWTVENGGEIFFQFAKKIPLLGSPTYRTIRIRATRTSSALDYVVESVIPKTGVFASHFYLFDVSDSGIGLPNGITSLTIDPAERTERKVDLDILEGPIQILGKGKKSTPRADWPRH